MRRNQDGERKRGRERKRMSLPQSEVSTKGAKPGALFYKYSMPIEMFYGPLGDIKHSLLLYYI